MNRRGFLKGILAAGVAPAFVGSGVLMPVREIWTPAIGRTAKEIIARRVDGVFVPELWSEKLLARLYSKVFERVISQT